MSGTAADMFAARAAEFGIQLTERQLAQFQEYATHLLAANELINLTRIDDLEAVYVKHFLDSLTCALAQDRPPGNLVDVGSGAGFPGLVLKICWPSTQVTLVESVGKKAAFLESMVQTLNLSGVRVIADRAEVLGQQTQHREQYDLAVARAVAPLNVLVEYLLPLLRPDGRMLAQKGRDPAEEVAAAAAAVTILGGEHLATQAISIPGLNAPRHLVWYRKVTSTPAAYPRRPGRPGKRPLA